MVDIDRLNRAVEESGMKRYVIAERCGMNKRTLQNKLNGRSVFTAPEIQSISHVLRLSKAERDNIFFAQQVN